MSQRVARRVAARQQLCLELGILEDLAVLGDPDRAVLVAERLTAAREVDDRQPPCAQGHARLDVDLLVVRPAVRDRAGHRQQSRRWKLAPTFQIQCPSDAAHDSRLSRRRGQHADAGSTAKSSTTRLRR